MRKIVLILAAIFLAVLVIFLLNPSKGIKSTPQPELVRPIESPAKEVRLLPAEPTEKEIIKVIQEVQRKYSNIIKMIAKKYGYNENIIIAVIVVESGGNHKAVSTSNAIGLMQVKRSTALGIDERNILSPLGNINAGTKYLRKQENRFRSLESGLAAYNLGPTELSRRLKRGFDPDTFKYVRKVKEVLLYI